MSNQQQIHQLTFTRFVAAIAIVIYHFGDQAFFFGNKLAKPVVHNFNIGVSYFFILSGFVMMVAYYRKAGALTFSAFIVNRIARILPVYYLAAILMLLYIFFRVHVMRMTSPKEVYPIDIFLVGALIQSWFVGKATAINTAAWSLSVELFFYVLFPILLNRVYKRRSFGQSFAIGVSVFIISQVVYFLLILNKSEMAFWMYHPVLHLNEFMIGNLVGLLFFTRRRPGYYALLVWSLLALLTMILLSNVPGIFFHNGVLAVVIAPLIYFIASDSGRVSIFFSKPIFIWLGEISYSLYILQFPLFFYFTGVLTFTGIKYVPNYFFIYLVLLIVCSGLSYQFIEIPLRQKIRGWYRPDRAKS